MLDARIRGHRDRVDDLVLRYRAGRDLGRTITYTRPDGTRVTFDGKIDRSKSTDGSSLTSLGQFETFASGFFETVGRDGTYRDSAATLARRAGVDLDYAFAHEAQACPGPAGPHTASGNDAIASFCTAAPRRIYVNEQNRGYREETHSRVRQRHQARSRCARERCPALKTSRHSADEPASANCPSFRGTPVTRPA